MKNIFWNKAKYLAFKQRIANINHTSICVNKAKYLAFKPCCIAFKFCNIIRIKPSIWHLNKRNGNTKKGSKTEE